LARRRGELCAWRWDLLDLDQAVLVIRTSIAQEGAKTWEKPIKTHEPRSIVLRTSTVGLLRAYRRPCENDAASVGAALAPDGRISSHDLDHAAWPKLNTLSQRYAPCSAGTRTCTSRATTRQPSSSPPAWCNGGN